MHYSTGRTYRNPRFGNTTRHHVPSHATLIRARLLELQDALTTADEAMRSSLTQRINALSVKFPELKGEALCQPQPQQSITASAA